MSTKTVGLTGTTIWLTIFQLIISEIPWRELINLAIQLIKERFIDIKEDKMTKEEAATENIRIMKEYTSNSPSVPTFWLKIIHEIAYAMLVKMKDPEKWQRMVDIADSWFNSKYKVTYKDAPDFMALYIPDAQE